MKRLFLSDITGGYIKGFTGFSKFSLHPDLRSKVDEIADTIECYIKFDI